jgi:hypothetical protein
MDNSSVWILATILITFFILLGFLVFITYKMIKDNTETKQNIQKTNTLQTGLSIAIGAIAEKTNAGPLIMERMNHLFANSDLEQNND